MRRIIEEPRTVPARSLSRLVLTTLVAGVLLVPARTAHAGATPEQTCAAGKNKTAGKYAACRENAEAKLAAGGDPSKYTDALDKCEQKFSTAWQKLEDKAAAVSASCPGDDTLIQGQTNAYTDRVAAQVAGNRFEDNGDGTVTDHETGLQWEKKTTTVGSGANYADPHDVDNLYTWSLGGALFPPDGSAYTDFIARLNGGAGAFSCYAGHCDWRLPTVDELATIRIPGCGAAPCVADPLLLPALAAFTWTSTTYENIPSYAWYVYFEVGTAVSVQTKTTALPVRAVRTLP
jgi:hypothetical protein